MAEVITVAPFGHASVSRSVEEASMDCEWPGPERLMVQTSISDFWRKREDTPPPKGAPPAERKKKRKAPPVESKSSLSL